MQKTGLLPFIKGGIFVLIVIFIYELIISWQEGSLGREVTWGQFSYKIKRYVHTPKLSSNPIHKMTNNDIETWLFDKNNTILQHMIQKIKYGEPVVTYSHESEKEKMYSLILIGLYEETIYRFGLRWKYVNQILYFTNPCLYYPIAEHAKESLKTVEKALNDDNFEKMLKRDYYNKIAIKGNLIGFDGDDYVLIPESTMYFGGEYFKPLKDILDKRQGKNCFFE